MDRERSTCLALVALGSVALLVCPQVAFGWIPGPPFSGVDTVLDTEDAYVSSYAGPGSQVEWLNNYNSSTSRIKGAECPALFKWDLSGYAGKQIVAAELHLAHASWDSAPVTSLVASTVNTDWSEGTVCYRYRALPSTEWTFSHSDATCATFGNFGTLTCWGFSANSTFKSYSYNGYTWHAMVIDPDLIYAMILDNPGGLAVTDARFYGSGNPVVYTKDQNSSVQPRLVIQWVAGTDTTPPTAVGSLAAAPGLDNGSVVLSFTAPTDPTDVDNKAFG
jgi:hypothetical protein